MEQLTNKEKAEITYKLLQERKKKKAKREATILKEYTIDRAIQNSKANYKKFKFKQCKRGN